LHLKNLTNIQLGEKQQLLETHDLMAT